MTSISNLKNAGVAVNKYRFGTSGKEPDPNAVEQLALLNALLSGKLARKTWTSQDYVEDPQDEKHGLFALLNTPFLKNGAGDELYGIADHYKNEITLRSLCEKRQPSLYFEFNNYVKESVKTLTFNQSLISGYSGIIDFLFLKAVLADGLENVRSVFSYIFSTGKAYQDVFQAIAVKAAEMIRDREKIKLPSGVNSEKISAILKEKEFSLEKPLFYNEVKNAINKMVFDSENINLISLVEKELGDIVSDEDVPAIINYLKSSNIKIDEKNAKYFIPIALNSLKNSGASYVSATSSVVSESDFAVNYYEDERASLEIIRENIVCASQLYYVMVLGDELGIFNIINHIATKKLPSGNMDIRNTATLKDLQLYIFNENFKDLRTGEIFKRTVPAERSMFYKQVYNSGDGGNMEGMSVNTDFYMHWSILMKECADYIQKQEESENVLSRQKIVQAMEDIQYNLSTFCTGMVKVATPVMYKEMDFVIERFLKNEEITRQITMGNSISLWKVIEKMLFEMQGEVPNVSALRNKAIFGHKILSSCAENASSLVADDEKFGELLSVVEAFIIAESQLQDSSENTDSEEEAPTAGNGSPVPAAGDDWNF